MERIYHVIPEYTGGPLLSLHEQLGDESYDAYAQRWPDAGELATYHVHYVHCYASIEEAHAHASVWGGVVVEIDCSDLAVEADNLEFAHPIVRDLIPESSIVGVVR